MHAQQAMVCWPLLPSGAWMLYRTEMNRSMSHASLPEEDSTGAHSPSSIHVHQGVRRWWCSPCGSTTRCRTSLRKDRSSHVFAILTLCSRTVNVANKETQGWMQWRFSLICAVFPILFASTQGFFCLP